MTFKKKVFLTAALSLVSFAFFRIALVSHYWPVVYGITTYTALLVTIMARVYVGRNAAIRTASTCLFAASAFLFLETGLRLTGNYSTYEENKDAWAQYISPRSTDLSELHRYTPNVSFTDYSAGEFAFPKQANSRGLIDGEHAPESTVFLGNSFIEGQGAPQFGSLPHLFAQECNRDVINMAISGADPFEQIRLYEYLRAQDDAVANSREVFICLHPCDAQRVAMRGGDERWGSQRDILWFDNPWNLSISLYGLSHTMRFVVHEVLDYDRFFFKNSEREQKLAQAEGHLYDKVLWFQQELQQDGITTHLLYTPGSPSNGRQPLVPDWVRRLDETTGVLNLADEFYAATDSMDREQLGWPKDKHFKLAGNKIQAELLAQML